jgi:hypothetical protein
MSGDNIRRIMENNGHHRLIVSDIYKSTLSNTCLSLKLVYLSHYIVQYGFPPKGFNEQGYEGIHHRHP